MAQPKRKHSHARTHKRRSHHSITVDALSLCPNCHEPKSPHRVCRHCGYYQKRQVMKAEEE